MKYLKCILFGVICVEVSGCVHNRFSGNSLFDIGVSHIIGSNVSDVVLCRGHGESDFDGGVREFEYLSWYKMFKCFTMFLTLPLCGYPMNLVRRMRFGMMENCQIQG